MTTHAPIEYKEYPRRKVTAEEIKLGRIVMGFGADGEIHTISGADFVSMLTRNEKE